MSKPYCCSQYWWTMHWFHRKFDHPLKDWPIGPYLLPWQHSLLPIMNQYKRKKPTKVDNPRRQHSFWQVSTQLNVVNINSSSIRSQKWRFCHGIVEEHVLAYSLRYCPPSEKFNQRKLGDFLLVNVVLFLSIVAKNKEFLVAITSVSYTCLQFVQPKHAHVVSTCSSFTNFRGRFR